VVWTTASSLEFLVGVSWSFALLRLLLLRAISCSLVAHTFEHLVEAQSNR
jgi:hypothetical protein